MKKNEIKIGVHKTKNKKVSQNKKSKKGNIKIKENKSFHKK